MLSGIWPAAHSFSLRTSTTMGASGASSLVRQVDRRNPVDPPNQVRPVLERVHSVFQIASDIVEPDPAKTHDGFFLASGIGNHNDRFVMIEHGAAPRGVLPVNADVQRTRQMRAFKVDAVPRIEELAPPDRSTATLPQRQVARRDFVSVASRLACSWRLSIASCTK